MQTKIPLDQIAVASPCKAPWEQMAGDERVRFCGQCRQHVYNLSEMTREEAETLVLEREGRLCVRFYQRFDGTLITRDCPVGVRAFRRAFALIGTAIGGVLLAMVGLLAIGGSAREDGAGELDNPVRRAWRWLFPPPNCVMGEPLPIVPPAPDQGPPNGEREK